MSTATPSAPGATQAHAGPRGLAGQVLPRWVRTYDGTGVTFALFSRGSPSGWSLVLVEDDGTSRSVDLKEVDAFVYEHGYLPG